MADVLVSGVAKNPISMLQEICQVWKIPIPAYKECGGSFQEFGTEVSVSFPVHESFPSEVVQLKGMGRTKKASKTKAAQDMLDYITSQRPHLLHKPLVTEVRDMVVLTESVV